jgi:hypothetical protein
MTKLSSYDTNFMQPETYVNKFELQTALYKLLQKFGVSGSVSVDTIPGATTIGPTGDQPAEVVVNISRSKALSATTFSPDMQLSPLEGALANA